MSGLELSRLSYKKRKAYFDNWRKYAKKVKEVANFLLGPSKVYVFGSVLKAEAHPALSDIDVAVVSEAVPDSKAERAKIATEIEEALGPMNPFEIHLLKPDQFEWYKRFMDRYEEVE